jgi:hypothetical protein
MSFACGGAVVLSVVPPPQAASNNATAAEKIKVRKVFIGHPGELMAR